jgi:hypothetical protein
MADVEMLSLHLRAGELTMAETLAAQLEFDSPMQARMLRVAVAHLARRPESAQETRNALVLSRRSQSPGVSRSEQAIVLLALELPSAGSSRLHELAREFEAELAESTGINRQVELARALLRAESDEHRPEPAVSPFPEVLAVEKAVGLEAAKRPKAAASAWHEVMLDTTHPALLLWVAYRSAKWQAQNGEPQIVIDLCNTIRNPPLMHWNWASTISPCLTWTSEAFEKLGDLQSADAARANRERLLDAARR